MCSKKKPRKASSYDYNPTEVIVSPFALPLFQNRDFVQPKRSRIPFRQDPELSRLPAIPQSGPGVSTRKGGFFTQHIMKELTVKKDREQGI